MVVRYVGQDESPDIVAVGFHREIGICVGGICSRDSDLAGALDIITNVKLVGSRGRDVKKVAKPFFARFDQVDTVVF